MLSRPEDPLDRIIDKYTILYIIGMKDYFHKMIRLSIQWLLILTRTRSRVSTKAPMAIAALDFEMPIHCSLSL